VRQTLIKVYQYSLIKWSIQGNTWNWIILEKFTTAYIPAEHRQNTGYIFLVKCVYVYCLKVHVYIHEETKVYTTEILSATFLA
jgi:hypothetical protein